MKQIVMVGLGGFIGASLRYLLNGYVHKLVKDSTFPFGTLAVNLVGCFLIGMFLQLDEKLNVFPPELRLLVFVGIFGAFTTYSTFSNDTMTLIFDKRLFYVFANISIHVIFGLAAVWLGRTLGHTLLK